MRLNEREVMVMDLGYYPFHTSHRHPHTLYKGFKHVSTGVGVCSLLGCECWCLSCFLERLEDITSVHFDYMGSNFAWLLVTVCVFLMVSLERAANLLRWQYLCLFVCGVLGVGVWIRSHAGSFFQHGRCCMHNYF